MLFYYESGRKMIDRKTGAFWLGYLCTVYIYQHINTFTRRLHVDIYVGSITISKEGPRALQALAEVDSSRDRGLLTDGGSSHGPPGEVTFRLTAP